MTAENYYLTLPAGVSDSVSDVPDTTTLFSMGEDLSPRPVPGREDEEYIPFGANDRLPYELTDLIGGDEVTSENKLFNVLTCYGAGLRLNDTRTGQPTTDAEVRDWVRRQSLPAYFLEQVIDMKYYYFTVCVLILNKARTRVNRIVHKEACFAASPGPTAVGGFRTSITARSATAAAVPRSNAYRCST